MYKGNTVSLLGGMETITVQTKYNTFKIKSQRLKDIFIGKQMFECKNI